jgi:hypothetical protein
VDAHAVLFAGNSLRLILFSSFSSSSSVALLVLLVLLRRRGDDDDVNALLVLFPSMISLTKDDGFGVNETNATPRRQKTTHFACFMRVLYIFLGLLAVVFRFRSKKRVTKLTKFFPPSRVAARVALKRLFFKINK